MTRKRIPVLPGARFGILTATGQYEVRRYSKRWMETWAQVSCDCGSPTKFVRMSSLKTGNTRSCGCRAGCIKHHGTYTRLYRIWRGMKRRCHQSTDADFPHYGARGIYVCQEWLKSFSAFRDWAQSNGYSDALTIERARVNDNYSPDNCIWLPHQLQQRNRTDTFFITAFGETKGITEWMDDPRTTQITRRGLRHRLARGWDSERALTERSKRDLK